MTAPPPLDSQAALFIDVDGTLLDIAARPELVRVPSRLPALLAALGRQRDGALALISGRPLAQLYALFAPWNGAGCGLHGGERRRADGSLAITGGEPRDRAAAVALDRLRAPLARLVQHDPRLVIEDKGLTIALHYRAAPEREAALRAAAEAMRRDAGGGLRLIAGKMVLEFQPRHRNKGAAIADFLDEPPFHGRKPVFLGDDVTDEDGFAEVNRRGGWSVRVGARRETAATYALASVAAARLWLAGDQEGSS